VPQTQPCTDVVCVKNFRVIIEMFYVGAWVIFKVKVIALISYGLTSYLVKVWAQLRTIFLQCSSCQKAAGQVT